MTWHWQSTCSACVFVSRQLGPGTPCPAHAGQWAVRPSGEAPGRAARLPTTDHPWPFTVREYARLMLLRARIRQAQPSALWDSPFEMDCT